MRGVLCRPSRNIACRACVLCVPLLIEFRLYERLHSLIDCQGGRRGGGVWRGALGWRCSVSGVSGPPMCIATVVHKWCGRTAASHKWWRWSGRRRGREKGCHIPVMLGPLSIAERLPPPTHMPVPDYTGSLLK